MSTTFGPILHSLRGRQINEQTAALRIHGDYGVPEASAANLARAMVESAREAEFVTSDDRLDAAAIEAASDVMPKPDANGARQAQATVRVQGQARPKPVTPEPTVPMIVKEEEPLRPLAAGVQVVVKIDASSLRPQQIAELVRELQRGSS